LKPGIRREADSPLVARLKGTYRSLLPKLIGSPRTSLIAIGATVGIGLIALPFLKEQFLPNFKERDFLMHWVEKPATSLDAMRRITIKVSQELRAVEGVRNFGSHIGRAQVADEVVGPNFTELWISLDPKVDYDATQSKIQEIIDGYPGLTRDVLTYLRERIKEVLTGASATVVVRTFGPDMTVLRATAKQVEQAIAVVPGVIDLHVEQQVLVPQIRIRVRSDAAAIHGLAAADIRKAANTLISGTRVGQVYHGQQTFDVAVWGEQALRTDLQALRQLLLESTNGGHVRLQDVADVVIEPAANEIRHEGASRRIDVTFNVKGAALSDVAQAAQAAVSKVSFSQGYHAEFLGEYAALSASRNQLLLLGLLVVIGIFILLQVEFGSLRLALLIGLSLPFALVGGLVAVLLSGGVLSLGSLVGFIAVLGIAARNGIMLISHYRHLEREEGMSFGPALVLRGAEERLAPILMTASCAALALLPLVIRANQPGHEIEAPMATVILGGLVTSTALNLLLMPALYGRFGIARRPLP
jgi:Cu/Ag efflux pump CusA